MLLQQNGNESRLTTASFRMEDSSQVGEARRHGITMAADLGFDETRTGRVGIIINELGNNLVRYGQKGQLILNCDERNGISKLEIVSIDSGPGILDLEAALIDGFTTGETPGTGLGAIKRLSDLFDIYTVADQGTVVLSIVRSQANLNRPLDLQYQFGAISIPIKGEGVCGDGWSLNARDQELQILMVDGLGHGPGAHLAATEAAQAFQKSLHKPLTSVIETIHTDLKRTRGAAVFLVGSQDGHVLQYCGAGNIRAILTSERQTKTLISQNGTAGVQLRTIRAETQLWDQESLLILHSDGITSRWDLNKYLKIKSHHPLIIAAVILRDHSRGSDDSTILVVRKNS